MVRAFPSKKVVRYFLIKEFCCGALSRRFFFVFFDRRGSKGYAWRAPLTALGRALWASFKTIATTFYFPESFGFLSACLFSVKKTHMSCPYRQREAFKPRRKGRTKRASCGCTATFALLQKKRIGFWGRLFVAFAAPIFFCLFDAKYKTWQLPPAALKYLG